MLLSDAKKSGAFTTRVNLGQFFPQEQRNGQSEEKWKKYLESISANEYITLREPTTDEIFKLRKKGTIPDGILKGVDAGVAKAVIEEERDISEEVTDDMRRVIKGCIVDHSFEDEPGKPSSIDDVWDMIQQRSSLEMAVMRAWSASYQDLTNPTEENSRR